MAKTEHGTGAGRTGMRLGHHPRWATWISYTARKLAAPPSSPQTERTALGRRNHGPRSRAHAAGRGQTDADTVVRSLTPCALSHRTRAECGGRVAPDGTYIRWNVEISRHSVSSRDCQDHGAYRLAVKGLWRVLEVLSSGSLELSATSPNAIHCGRVRLSLAGVLVGPARRAAILTSVTRQNTLVLRFQARTPKYSL